MKHATLFFSRSTPNLATVIPAMDVIDEQLMNNSLNRTKYDTPISASPGVAKKTLNRYYNMTDWSEVYRIAMGRLIFIWHVHLLIDSPLTESATSTTQTCILQECRVGTGVDKYG